MTVTIKVQLKERLNECGMEQKQLSDRTGVSVRTISELVNNKTVRFPKTALEKIATELNISDMNELLTIVSDE